MESKAEKQDDIISFIVAILGYYLLYTFVFKLLIFSKMGFLYSTWFRIILFLVLLGLCAGIAKIELMKQRALKKQAYKK